MDRAKPQQDVHQLYRIAASVLARRTACNAAQVRNPCRIEEESERMIVNMA
jgi:hypothetical protein